MSIVKIQCFKFGSSLPEHSFFILSKGIHTGRPSLTPYRNCFVCICEDEGSMNQYYWLVYGLWQGRRFEKYLIGSVILFIHIRDLRSIITNAVLTVRDIEKVAVAMQQLLVLEIQLKDNLERIRNAKKGLIHSCFKKLG